MRLLLLAVLLASTALWALASTTEVQTLTTERAREAIAPFYQALNAGSDPIDLINRATAPDWMSCGGNETCKRRDQVAMAIASVEKAVPDLKWEIKEVVVSGDRVIVRGEATGTPAKAFLGVAPNGVSFRVMSIDVHTIKDGKIAKSYHVEDWMGALRQLSAQ
jgi:predicted ester cyclase